MKPGTRVLNSLGLYRSSPATLLHWSGIINLHSLLRLVGYNKLRVLGLWLRWIEQAPPEQLGTLEETLGVNVVKFGET